jgi:hypothetical protein
MTIIPKISKAELRFFWYAHLPNGIYLPFEFHVDTSYNFRVIFRTKFKVKNDKGNNSKIRQDRVMDLLHCTSTQWDISTFKDSCWYLLLFQKYFPEKKSYRTDGRTTRWRYAHPSRSIKIIYVEMTTNI